MPGALPNSGKPACSDHATSPGMSGSFPQGDGIERPLSGNLPQYGEWLFAAGRGHFPAKLVGGALPGGHRRVERRR